MAYYTALVSAWNNASLATGATLPSGVTGSLLTGLTTTQKLAAINALGGDGRCAYRVVCYWCGQLLNCINWTEFAALTAAQQTNLLQLCTNDGLLLGGTANTEALSPMGCFWLISPIIPDLRF